MILFQLLAVAEIFFGTVNSEISTGDDNLGKIINGRNAEEGEFPYQVQITQRGFYKCGGSIIDLYHVITTASCVVNSRQNEAEYLVVAGVLYRYDYLNPHRVELHFAKIYSHKDFLILPDRVYNNIAIVRVKGGFRFTKFVQPVLLNRDTPKEVMCNVTGWGVITTNRMNVTLEVRKNSPLQVVEEQLITWEKCKQLATVVPIGTLCVAHTEEGAAPRYGDADGAIVCQEKLTGFVSYAYGCAAPVQHAFSTDIFFFKDWIAKKLKKSYEELDQSLHKKHEIFTKLQS